MNDAAIYCAAAGCTKELVPGEAHLGQDSRLYCSYRCAARDNFSGPVLPGPANRPSAN